MTGVPSRSTLLIIWICIVFTGLIIFYLWITQIDVELCLNNPVYDCLRCLQVRVPTYNYSVTTEEKEFPLAYSILVYTNPERAMQLLTAIYRPHNFYCIHVDRKTHSTINNLLALYGKCFNSNVFFVPEHQRTNVKWGYFSVLEPELTCARLLLSRSKKWRYWINLTGQEFPLRTNRELVLALKALDGVNVVPATFKHRNFDRMPPRSETSLNIVWYKGSVHVAVRREFVDYMLNDDKAIRTLQDLKDYELKVARGIHIDETYFQTLNQNVDTFPIPGALLQWDTDEELGSIIRYKVWLGTGQPCGSGHYVRNICMLGVLDLPHLLQSPSFFANKFLPTFEPEAYAVLESWLSFKVSFETLYGVPHRSFDIQFYEQQAKKWPHL